MRRFGLAVAAVLIAQGAQAADLPDLFDMSALRGSLRDGPVTTVVWQGFYVGGQYGINSTNFTLGNAAPGLSALSSTVVGGAPTVTTSNVYNKTTAYGYGGFVGYNWQFEDAVIGFDLNYNKAGGPFASASVNPITTTQVVGANTYVTTTTGAGTIKVTDYGSFRARAGWAAGNFMPYVTGGIALGRADLTRSITVAGTVDNGGGPVAYGPVTATQAKNGALIYGYSIGGGLDTAIIGGLFLRTEVEWTRFTQAWGMDASIVSARAGAGYRF